MSETDKPNPLGVYGRTKLQGEQAIRQSGCRSLVFRTSWVYAARGSNFVRTIVRLAGERGTLDVVSDQVGAPTSAELIAGVTALCLYRVTRDKAFGEQAGGAYHLTSAGETSWHGLAGICLTECTVALVLNYAFARRMYIPSRLPSTDQRRNGR